MAGGVHQLVRRPGQRLFFATTNRGAIVEPAGELLIDRSDLAGMLDTLDGDFDTSTRAYIGRSWPTDADLPAMYAEEVQLAAGNTARISTLQESALAYYTQEARRHSRILLALRRLLRGSTSDMAPVITALYHNQAISLRPPRPCTFTATPYNTASKNSNNAPASP